MNEPLQKYLAYPFLYEEAEDLRCDFEILTDEISSMIGLVRSLVKDEALREDLSAVNELMYHINPSLRTKIAVSREELAWLERKTAALEAEIENKTETKAEIREAGRAGVRFVLPQGSEAACLSHVIRNRCKALVRLLSRHAERAGKIEGLLFDFINLFSGYFFFLALKLNRDAGIEEREFKSRVY
jgi:ATP:cob(I)alamin adenosyltransferase